MKKVVALNPSLGEIVALAHQQLALEAQVETAELTLKTLNARLRAISEEALPLAMKEAKLEKFTLDTGESVEVKEDFAVGIPAPRREEAWGWLEGHGFGGLIRTEVSVAFGKGELEKAQKLLTALAKKNLPAELSRNIAWQTLKAFVNEQTRDKKPIPLELFGAIPMNKAVIKAPKKAKG